MRKELKPTDILKLLPGTNCRECGERTCFAFAFKLVRQETEISKCTFLFSEKYLEKGKVLLQLLKDVGYNLSSKEGRQDG
jgi:ArsR family metal-binding transcriptional regulator